MNERDLEEKIEKLYELMSSGAVAGLSDEELEQLSELLTKIEDIMAD